MGDESRGDDATQVGTAPRAAAAEGKGEGESTCECWRESGASSEREGDMKQGVGGRMRKRPPPPADDAQETDTRTEDGGGRARTPLMLSCGRRRMTQVESSEADGGEGAHGGRRREGRGFVLSAFRARRPHRAAACRRRRALFLPLHCSFLRPLPLPPPTRLCVAVLLLLLRLFLFRLTDLRKGRASFQPRAGERATGERATDGE